jgi:hypothetical protein
MTWTAQVTDKGVQGDGIFFATLSFTDGTTTVVETYRAIVPTSSWLPDTVRDRLRQLEASTTFDVPIGVIDPSSDPSPRDPNIALFIRRVQLMKDVQALVDAGVVPVSNPNIVQLKNWIANNIGTYWNDLIG